MTRVATHRCGSQYNYSHKVFPLVPKVPRGNEGIEYFITKVKESQIRERETNLKENRFWLSTLQFAIVNSEDPNVLINKFDELVERVTKERVQQTAKKYLDMSNFVKIVLYPAEK